MGFFAHFITHQTDIVKWKVDWSSTNGVGLFVQKCIYLGLDLFISFTVTMLLLTVMLEQDQPALVFEEVRNGNLSAKPVHLYTFILT